MQEASEVKEELSSAHQESPPQRTPLEAPSKDESESGHRLDELETLRESYNTLKAELELLKTPDDGHPRLRAYSLRILQDRIDDVLNSGTIGTLNGRLGKAETALADERQRYAELQEQLEEQSKSQESIALMKARLKQSERELSDLQQSYAELKIESEAKDAQLLEQRITVEELKTALHHEKSRVHELIVENKDLALEKSSEVSKLMDALKSAQTDHKNSVQRVRHLERLLMKLTENSTPDVNDSESIEATSDLVSSKLVPSLPDPPSMDEPSTEAPTTISLTETRTTDQENNGLKGKFSELSEGQEEDFQNESSVELISEAVESSVHTTEVKQSWKWGVSGIWSYVTGDTV